MTPVSDGWLLKFFTNYIAPVGKELKILESYGRRFKFYKKYNFFTKST